MHWIILAVCTLSGDSSKRPWNCEFHPSFTYPNYKLLSIMKVNHILIFSFLIGVEINNYLFAKGSDLGMSLHAITLQHMVNCVLVSSIECFHVVL